MEMVIIVAMMLGFTSFGLYVLLKGFHQQSLDRKQRRMARDIDIDANIAKIRKTHGDMLRRLSR